MAGISRWLPILAPSERALAVGRPVAPYAPLLLFGPVFCCDSQCRVLWLCGGLSVAVATCLYVLLGLVHELRLLGERLTF